MVVHKFSKNNSGKPFIHVVDWLISILSVYSKYDLKIKVIYHKNYEADDEGYNVPLGHITTDYARTIFNSTTHLSSNYPFLPFNRYIKCQFIKINLPIITEGYSNNISI